VLRAEKEDSALARVIAWHESLDLFHSASISRKMRRKRCPRIPKDHFTSGSCEPSATSYSEV